MCTDMKKTDDLLHTPEALRNYDLLNSLGIIESIAYYKRKVHDLEELLSDAIEIFNQENFDQLIDYIISNLVERFVPSYLQFTFKAHGQDDNPNTICYHNLKRIDSPAPVSALEPYNSFFHQYPGPISFPLFEYSVNQPHLSEQLKPLDPEIIIPVNGPSDLYGLIIIGKKIVEGEYTDDEIVHIDRLMRFVSISLQNAIHYHSSVTDFKTQLYNHSFFMKRLTEELAKVKRYNKSMAVMLIDIDFFKQLNDRYGHLAGDKVLFELARTLEKSLRREDVVARFGGEEFVIMLPESTLLAAYHVAERVRQDIENMEISYLGNTLSITVSIGVRFIDSSRLENPKTIIDQADNALYTSKSEGRNRVTFYKPGLLFKVNHKFIGIHSSPAVKRQ